jgi:hypothetical protein
MPWLILAIMADGWATKNTKEAWMVVKYMCDKDDVWDMVTDMSDLDWQ